jgi:type IV pilus assembly protein PilW
MKHSHHQKGITLVELLIATALGMFIVLVVTGLVISSKLTQSTQNDAATLQDTARFALDNISRSVKQAGYVNFDQDDVPVIDTENMTAGIIGFDAGSLKATQSGIDSPIASKSSSDILALRFFGSNVDNTILNCAGSGVKATTEQNELKKERSWSIYYVSNEVDDEPALYCKYDGKTTDGNTKFRAQAIARGVESFQVLYGLNTNSHDNDSNTTQFLNATQISALDSAIPDSELNKKTHWKKITAIKVAMLIRSTKNSRLESSTATYNLFGEDYGNSFGASDKGTQINESDLPLTQRKRMRKVVSTTIQLRNSMS